MHHDSLFNIDLINRYDKTGPRYTSYPTAPQFEETFGLKDYQACVNESNEYLIPLPISLYIHIPFCNTICYYCGCSKIVTKNRERAKPYLENLYKEIELQSKLFDEDRHVAQLHLGGGTPTFVGEYNLSKLMGVLRKNFTFLDKQEGEYSIEIDPREVTPESISLLSLLGFNRISIGVQDLNPEVQRAVNRIQSLKQTADVINSARDRGFKSVNIDLIYGLPLQTTNSFEATLDEIIKLSPDRIALYNYAHLPNMFKTQKQISSAQLPDSSEKLEILRLSIQKLTESGYKYIGMDHFAKPEDDLAVAQERGTLRRNFQGYSTRSDCDIVGFGVTAISQISDCYSQNAKTLEEYDKKIKSGRLAVNKGIKLDEDDLIRRDIIMRLMCDFGLDFESVEDHYMINFREQFKNELWTLKEMEQDGLLKVDNEKIVVNTAGRLLIRNICMIFDKYIKIGNEKRFSRAL